MEPISAGTMLAITALSSLAQAGGAGAMGYFQGKSQEDAIKWDKKKWLREMQERDEDQAQNNLRYREEKVAAAPANSLNMLSGISNLSQGMAKSSPLDYLGYLARG